MFWHLHKNPSIEKSWGNPILRTRGGGMITATENKVTVDFGIMSFYENGPEYDMNKVIGRKNVPIYSYSLPFAIEEGYSISGILFKFPEDFLVEDQIPKNETFAYWNKLEKERDEKEREDKEIREILLKAQQKKSSISHKHHNNPAEKKDAHHTKAHQTRHIDETVLPSKKSYDDSLDKFLEPLGGRKFSKQTNCKDEEVDMNIIIVCLDEERRKQILSVDGDNWTSTDKYKGGTLNGVKISAVEMGWGSPLGDNNYKFIGWQLMQVRF
jgi:hypothetical protein